MNRSEAFKAWLKALRSGEYTQCSGALKRMEDGQPSYCCLGVITEILASQFGLEWENHCDIYSPVRPDGPNADIVSVLMEPIADFLGIDTHGELPLSACAPQDTLAMLNDREGWTFPQIADVIEKHLMPEAA